MGVMLSLFLLSLASLTRGALVAKHDHETRDNDFHWVAVGDSWAAGAATTNVKFFDGNADDCYRNVESWEAQMSRDTTWTTSSQDFHFKACSGARLIAATHPEPRNHQQEPQLSNTGTPSLVTMQLGGNDCYFGSVAKECIFKGGSTAFSYPDYPDPKSGCTQIINDHIDFILGAGEYNQENGFYGTERDTIKSILQWPGIQGNKDFRLYIIGYAEFFNEATPESDWCNTETFGVWWHPKLSRDLRKAINSAIRKVNEVTKGVIQDIGDTRIHFVDPSPLFEGHRFCEPKHSFNDQWYNNDVWFYNLNPPDLDPPIDGKANMTLLKLQEAWTVNEPRVSDESSLDTLSADTHSGPGDEQTLRAFHPKLGGHTAIKNVVVAQIRADNVPGSAPVPPPPKSQPYASGEIHIHVREAWYPCPLTDTNNLAVEVTMWDSTSKGIGYLPLTQAGDVNPVSMGSLLEDKLILVPEHAGAPEGYIQFQIGNLKFDTLKNTDKTTDTWCSVGGWDPRAGPDCSVSKEPAWRQMDCNFPAPKWNGGAPSGLDFSF